MQTPVQGFFKSSGGVLKLNLCLFTHFQNRKVRQIQKIILTTLIPMYRWPERMYMWQLRDVYYLKTPGTPPFCDVKPGALFDREV
jgi:hypothetical protein